MPSLSGMWPRTANPPDSSPPSRAFVSIIFGATFLNPTGTSYTRSPNSAPSLSTIAVMFTVLTTGPRCPRASNM